MLIEDEHVGTEERRRTVGSSTCATIGVIAELVYVHPTLGGCV